MDYLLSQGTQTKNMYNKKEMDELTDTHETAFFTHCLKMLKVEMKEEDEGANERERSSYYTMAAARYFALGERADDSFLTS
jgi:hypothetical protein